ncbi:hypothetical protein [Terrisporobacter petrolearius]|uniref:hypothetical protein n=1 Tax=Terrisporobacter petrolearius TaxID=1460447 RepID=UPI0022E7BA76|nr:hypothetical protein [Terrisporobacter petrolearius]
MKIGNILKERMDYFGITKDRLCDEALVDSRELDSILNNSICYNDIDELTLEFISQVVYCKPEYFIDETIRQSDIVKGSYNRGDSTYKSNKIKGILQSFVDDLAFLTDLDK